MVLSDNAENWCGKGADFLDAFLTSVGHGGASADPLSNPEEAAVHGDAGTNLLSGNRLNGLPDGSVWDETLMVSVYATVTGGSGIDRFEGDTGAGLSGSAFPEIMVTVFEGGVDSLLASGLNASTRQITEDGADIRIRVTNLAASASDRRTVGVIGLTDRDLATSDPAFHAVTGAGPGFVRTRDVVL